MKVLPFKRYNKNATGVELGGILLSSHGHSGHFLQTGQGIVKKRIEGCAVIIGMLLSPIPFAATSADREIAAGFTWLRSDGTFLNESGTNWISKCFVNVHILDISNSPFIQDIEITGIKTSIAFYNERMTTSTRRCTRAWSESYENAQIVIEGSNADVVARFPIPVPAVEQTTKEFSVSIWLQRIKFRTSRIFNWVQAGDKLNGVITQLSQRVVYLMRFLGNLSCDNTKDIAFNPILFEHSQCGDSFLPSARSGGVYT